MSVNSVNFQWSRLTQQGFECNLYRSTWKRPNWAKTLIKPKRTVETMKREFTDVARKTTLKNDSCWRDSSAFGQICQAPVFLVQVGTFSLKPIARRSWRAWRGRPKNWSQKQWDTCYWCPSLRTHQIPDPTTPKCSRTSIDLRISPSLEQRSIGWICWSWRKNSFLPQTAHPTSSLKTRNKQTNRFAYTKQQTALDVLANFKCPPSLPPSTVYCCWGGKKGTQL